MTKGVLMIVAGALLSSLFIRMHGEPKMPKVKCPNRAVFSTQEGIDEYNRK